MSFEDILVRILDDSGALAVALMGSDGIAISQHESAELSESPLAGELATAGAEFGRILSELRKASDQVSGGLVHEAMISLSRFHVLLRAVDEEAFVLVAVAPDGNLGKARYLLRRNLAALRKEL